MILQATTITLGLSAMTAGILYILTSFKTRKQTFYPLLLALPLFTIGFCMRLTGTQETIDLGYYLTDTSYLYINILFTAALILGQKKYWKTP
ncbi:hypothetical protein JW826_02340 [Candidatus Woesearchaeota archaeon]|nr:hypothetical protein [Candidatus Woesearchaeota archaeon]